VAVLYFRPLSAESAVAPETPAEVASVLKSSTHCLKPDASLPQAAAAAEPMLAASTAATLMARSFPDRMNHLQTVGADDMSAGAADATAGLAAATRKQNGGLVPRAVDSHNPRH
jgi:hypothetical protein